ncbi:Rieske (2Fe-2S) protein [Haliscomenobacter sp.]|uniref:Rieske (2Fe-2S) protein n=1 Tax=Haliscomenobacter sp. TaxID=2717303 RepID=UPI003BA924E9
MKTKHYFAELGALEEGRFVIREVANRSVGATLFQGAPLVILNSCPHAGAPICQGRITSKLVVESAQNLNLDSEHPVLRCPWHGWEFNLEDGMVNGFSSRLRLAKLQYELENDSLYIWL